jgi:polar amino acid transport system substrate-binding protein
MRGKGGETELLNARTVSPWGTSRVALLIAALVFAATLISPVPARALTQGVMTLDQESGGQLTDFTFVANEDASSPLSAITVAFPAGFDVAKATVDAVQVRQSDLVRLPTAFKQSRSGVALTLRFEPPLKPSNNQLQIRIGSVLTPTQGETYKLGVTYTSGTGAPQTLQGVTFAYATPSVAERVSFWLDRQALVSRWNSVPFFNLFLQPEYAVLALSTVWQGWLISIALVAVAFPLAIVGGLSLAFMKMSKVPPLRWFASAYVNVIRGTPLFLQIAIVFVGLPIAGLQVVAKQWFVAGFAVLALNSSAYLAEIFRAGIQSINKGQFEAASSLGMTYWQAMEFVIIPQTVKRVLPTMTSEFILLFKDTALLAAYGVFELMLYSKNLVARSGNITPFMVAAVFYLIVTVPLINLVSRLEARLALSEGGKGGSTAGKRTALRPAVAITPEAAMAGDGVAPSTRERR